MASPDRNPHLRPFRALRNAFDCGKTRHPDRHDPPRRHGPRPDFARHLELLDHRPAPVEVTHLAIDTAFGARTLVSLSAEDR
jgi:hypothetical protein